MSSVGTLLPLLQARRPLVHCVTNPVTMGFVADALNAMAARPIMARGQAEVGAIAGAADAVLINIGVPEGTEPYATAAKAAKRWVFDPVGAGGSTLRNEIAETLLALRPAIIRGNAGEILALGGQAGVVEGVDSLASPEEAAGVARLLADKFKTVVAMTGATDYVVSADRVVRLTGGDALMASVTGTGCVAGGVCAAFLTVAEDPFDAAVAALHLMSGAADYSAKTAKGPGSFKVAFLDALYSATTA